MLAVAHIIVPVVFLSEALSNEVEDSKPNVVAINNNMAKAKASYARNIWLEVAILSIVLIIDGAAGGVNLISRTTRLVKPLKKPEAIIRTTQSEDGDIIDCFDIYKQPAFDHPALANHTIQMMPSDSNREKAMASNSSSLSSPVASSSAQLRRLKRDCPRGTIPILRTWNNDMPVENGPTGSPVVEHAKLLLGGNGGKYYGASGYINVWNLQHVEPADESNALIIMAKMTTAGVNYIFAGWTVSKPVYGDQKTRLTIYWTADGTNETGCHNLNCPGFVQTNPHFYLGATFNMTSTYGGEQAEFKVTIYLDQESNNWWLNYFDTPVGYWPASIFEDFSVAEMINWGGDVGLSSGNPGDNRHSTTEMGSGHYPSEGLFKISAYVAEARYISQYNQELTPYDSRCHATKKHCYQCRNYGEGTARPGYAVYFGGNGQGKGCSK